jgi:molybdopterin synthase sulfur carrier subunit
MKTVHVRYFAFLREQRGRSEETLMTGCRTPRELYVHLCERHGLTLPWETLTVAVNEEFEEGDYILADQDAVAYLPPVAGG